LLRSLFVAFLNEMMRIVSGSLSEKTRTMTIPLAIMPTPVQQSSP